MKILQVVSGADEIAGVQRHVSWLAGGSRFRHAVATTPAPVFEKFLRDAGHEVHVFHDLAGFRRVARAFAPDIVHAHLGRALVAGALYKATTAGCRLVYSQHILYPQSEKVRSLPSAARRRVLRWSYGRCNRIIAVSAAVKEEMLRRGERFPTEVILNGVPAKPENPRSPVVDGLRIIGISRLQPEKRPYDFVELARRLDDDRTAIVVYGAGRMHAELAEAASGLGSKTPLTFAGFRRDIEGAIAEAHLFVHFGEEEACPLAILEALTSGLPVVTLAVGGNTELVPEAVGKLFPVGDVQGMAAYIRELLDQPERIKAMSEAALHWSRKFTVARMIGDIDELYAKLER